MNHQKTNKIRFPRALESVLGFLENMFFAMLAVSLIFTYFFRIVSVSGDSMSDTLRSGERVIMTASCRHPKQGDIVVFFPETSYSMNQSGELVKGTGLRKELIKRVIAAEGQTIDIDFEKGHVYVDGEKLDESYISGLTHSDQGAFTGHYPVTVPKGYVFVMGDNRRDSIDSRADEIGFVAVDDIMGRVIFRLSPFNRMGLAA